MKRIIRFSTALVASALFASAASAAINSDAIHLALDSLLVASSKMSVVNAMNRNGKPPSNNTEAGLGMPNTMITPEISSIVVAPGGVIDIHLAPVTGTDHGLVQLVPHRVKGPKGGDAIEFACSSPNIPDIAKVAQNCTYVPRK